MVPVLILLAGLLRCSILRSTPTAFIIIGISSLVYAASESAELSQVYASPPEDTGCLAAQWMILEDAQIMNKNRPSVEV